MFNVALFYAITVSLQITRAANSREKFKLLSALCEKLNTLVDEKEYLNQLFQQYIDTQSEGIIIVNSKKEVVFQNKRVNKIIKAKKNQADIVNTIFDEIDQSE